MLFVSKQEAIQFVLDPCLTSWEIQVELAASDPWQCSAPEVPLHKSWFNFQRMILQSLPADTNRSFPWNVGKWTCDTLEVCFLRHSSWVNFFCLQTWRVECFHSLKEEKNHCFSPHNSKKTSLKQLPKMGRYYEDFLKFLCKPLFKIIENHEDTLA